MEDILNFCNCYIDLTTNVIHKNNTKGHSTGYALLKSSDEQNKVICDMILNILPNKIDRDNFVKMARISMSTKRDGTVYILNGKYSKEKDVIIMLLMDIVGGHYSCFADDDILQIENTNIPYQQVSKLLDKRVVIFYSDMINNKNINDVLIKNDNIKVNFLLNNCDVKLNFTGIYVTKNIKNINNIFDNYVTINFDFPLNNIKNNVKYDSDNFRSLHKHAMLFYILSYKL